MLRMEINLLFVVDEKRNQLSTAKAATRRLIVSNAVAVTELLSSLGSQCCLDGNIGQQVRRQTVPLL